MSNQMIRIVCVVVNRRGHEFIVLFIVLLRMFYVHAVLLHSIGKINLPEHPLAV